MIQEERMKRILLVALCLSLFISLVYAQEMVPGTNKKTAEVLFKSMPVVSSRTVPAYTFTKTPTALMTSYYDYMIGSYNGLPLRVIPDVAGGGYFLTYHGQRTATGERRAFYAYLDAQGNVINNNEITAVVNREGYTTVAVDPVSGKPLYAWHANADGTTDTQLEVQFTSDAFIDGFAGLFNDLQIAINNPSSVTATSGSSTDNEFIWPTAQIGPSPIDGKRRIYIIARNSVSHTYGPSENPKIAYADFNGDDIEMGTPLVWTYTSIPEMDDWNHNSTWRRPFHGLAADGAGNIYYMGYHFATEADGTTDIPEPDMDVFKCGNYGTGTWTRISAWSKLPTWNPPTSATDATGYFKSDATGLPYADTDLYWQIANSSHLNATVDDNGRLHATALWALNNAEGYYYPAMQYPKEFVFDPLAPTDQQYAIHEVWPQKDTTDDHDVTYTPWDLQAPWGVVDSWTQYTNGWAPDIADSWDFPYWDQSAHSDAMFFHYSNLKVTEGNGHGMLATVWQNCLRAKKYNADSDTDYAAWANTPEMWISVSSDNGSHWSEPIKLNNIETPQFAGLKPMWVYPADKVIYTGMQGDQKVGKLGIMFYNDYTWGSFSITPSVHPTNDGGQVMFTELQIVFPTEAGDDPAVAPVVNLLQQNYPNPFNPETTISFDMPKTAPANLSIYNVKGQLVKTLFNGTAQFGRNSQVWNGTDNNGSKVTSGLYFYRLTTDGKVETRKMMLMK